MIRIVIGIVIGLLIGTYFGIRLQVSDLTSYLPGASQIFDSHISPSSTGFDIVLNNPGTGLQISESMGQTMRQFFQGAEFQSIVNQIKANPGQTQVILQQSLTTLFNQLLGQYISSSSLSQLSNLLRP